MKKVLSVRHSVAILFPGSPDDTPYDDYIGDVRTFLGKQGTHALVYYTSDDKLPDKDLHLNYIITGSCHSVHDTFPWIDELSNFVSSVIHSDHKNILLGICFGHQLIAKIMGGAVSEAHDWTIQIRTYRGFDKSFNLFACHSQKVSHCPPGAHSFLTHPEDQHAGLFYPHHGVLTLQGHPESSPKRVNSSLSSEYCFIRRRDLPVSEAVARALKFDPDKMEESRASRTKKQSSLSLSSLGHLTLSGAYSPNRPAAIDCLPKAKLSKRR